MKDSFVLSEKTANSMRRMGPRAVYGQHMYVRIQQGQSDWVLLSADLGRSSGLDRVRKEFPEYYLSCGIAEQNMVGVSAGLAREGFKVFASSFAPFIAMRASEQVRMNAGYMGEPINLVALGSGLAMGFLGNSHFGLEDIAVMRTIPGMRIVCPADAGSVPKAIDACADAPFPTYLRLTGVPGSASAYTEDYQFIIDKPQWIRRSGSSHLIISNGAMVGQSIIALERLETLGYSVDLIDMHTIGTKALINVSEIAKEYKSVIVVEEHFLSGGLASAFLEAANSSGCTVPTLPIGIKDHYVPTGDWDWMLNQLGIDAEGIFRKCEEWLRARDGG